MSTQAGPHVSLSYCQEQSNIRLIELPLELIENITSNKHLALTLKSATQVPGPLASKQSSHVVLCTNDKTFAVKQVQTSNTVLLLRSTIRAHEDGGLPHEGLQAFATCSSTLELQPFEVDGKAKSAAQWLFDLLPAWSSSMRVAFDQTKDRNGYFDDVPFSHSECDDAWHKVFAFEVDGQAFRPADQDLVELWRTLRQCIDVTATFKLEDVYAVMRESDYPLSMIEALLVSSLTECPQRDTFVFVERATVSWIHKLLSASSAAGASTSKNLPDLLPEEWQATGREVSSSDARADVTGNVAGIGLVDNTAIDAKQNSTGAAKRIGKQTNWHEKFKRAKK